MYVIYRDIYKTLYTRGIIIKATICNVETGSDYVYVFSYSVFIELLYTRYYSNDKWLLRPTDQSFQD